MAVDYHIAGPVTFTYGGEDMGRTDGLVRASIVMVEPSIPITDDSAGGMAVDEITQDSYALVRLTLQARDTAILNDVRARLKGYQTLAGDGEAQRPGYLRRADNNENRAFVIAGTKLTANDGMQQLTFHDAIADAETDTEVSEIGVQASRLSLVLRCYSSNQSGTWKVFTPANITGS
jgi:hypothetical protein